MSRYINGTDYCPICKVYDGAHSPECNMGIVETKLRALESRLTVEGVAEVIAKERFDAEYETGDGNLVIDEANAVLRYVRGEEK